jgi:hypothetical protein
MRSFNKSKPKEYKGPKSFPTPKLTSEKDCRESLLEKIQRLKDFRVINYSLQPFVSSVLFFLYSADLDEFSSLVHHIVT